jgi:hypothetical protein
MQSAEGKGGRLLVVDAATGTAEEQGGLRWEGLPKNPIYGSESEESGDEQLEGDLADYAAQRKGEERPQLAARKSVQILTRAQMGEGSGKRQKEDVQMALVAVDSFGGEIFGGGC